ncbi:MAG: hypothetical protein WC365_07190 [Candidatus Babeliales bacterium]|jgi:hypothetical protein
MSTDVSIYHKKTTEAEDNPAYDINPSDWMDEHKMADGALPLAKLTTTGTPSSSTFLRGDGAWASPSKSAHTYVIYKIGSTYYAVKHDGTILSNSNLETGLMPDVFTNMPNGGDILFKNEAADGDYSIAQRIDMSGLDNFNIYGERGARIFLAASRPEVPANREIFYANGLTNSKIKGLILDGNYANSSAWTGVSAYGNIHLEGNCSNVDIEGNDILNAAMYGVFVSAYAGDTIENVNTQKNRFVQGGMWNSIYYLVWDAAGYGIKGCDISFNDVQDFCDIGICVGQALGGTVENVNVHHNRIHNGNLSATLGSSNPPAIFGIRFEGVVKKSSCHNNHGWLLRQGWADDAYGSNNVVHDNTFANDISGGSGVDIIQVMGTAEKIYSNILYNGKAWAAGIHMYGGTNVVENNTITKTGGSDVVGITEHPDFDPNDNVYKNNDVRTCDYKITLADGTGQIHSGNLGNGD